MNTNVEKREYVDEVLIPRIRKFSLMRLSSFRILVFDIFLLQHFPLLSFPIHPSKCLPFDIFLFDQSRVYQNNKQCLYHDWSRFGRILNDK